MSSRLISLDLETTGLDERIHEAWEIGLVDVTSGIERLYEFPPRRLDQAQQQALQISGYYSRASINPDSANARVTGPWPDGSGNRKQDWLPCTDAALEIARITSGAQLMGCAIQFDMRFLAELLRRYGCEPAWHHRALDLGSYAAGVLRARKPFASSSMAERVPNSEPHTALGDARWNVAVYNYLINYSADDPNEP